MKKEKIFFNKCLILWFQHFMFFDLLLRFIISKETQMWCACDIATFRKYIFGLHPQFLANRFMNFSNFLIDKRYGSFFVQTFALCSQSLKTLQGRSRDLGVTFYIWGPCLYCIRWHCFFFFLRRDPNPWVNVRPRRTLDWPCPGSRWTRGDELSPSLLTCCRSIAGQAGAGEGQEPQGCAAHLHSGWCPANVRLGRSKGKKQAVLVSTWGKGEPWALLAGVWIGPATVGNALQVPLN